jgi:hypothetical protein
MKTDRIANYVLRRQERTARWLNNRTQHWNKASKIIALLLFVLLFGSLCLLAIIHSL